MTITHRHPLAGSLPATTAHPPRGVQEQDKDVPSLHPGSAGALAWPRWAHTARLAGAYFYPGESDAVIVARLDRLAAEHVSVVVADSPLGEQYKAWVDDGWFAATCKLLARVVELAHARGLKVVMYHNALELISEGERNPGLEHPEWLQHGLDGAPVLFNDVSNAEEHWLHAGIWDFWAHPCDSGEISPNGSSGASTGSKQSFRALAWQRIRSLVRTGIDGLWVDQAYLQSSVGSHHDLWPSADPCSAAAFTAATDLPLPRRVDWDDPIFRRWVVWRHTQIADYLLAELQVARAINPAIVLWHENSCVDTGRATYVAADPASWLGVPGVATAHEVETIADRMDHGATGMQAAGLEQWLAFRTMIAFARAVDRPKPSWILTYGCRERDSAQLAGFVLAEGANFYENRGPQMADSVGRCWRTTLLRWIAAHEDDFYGVDPAVSSTVDPAVDSAAEVGLLYSPRNRDLLDTVSGEPYDAADSIHFAAYRAAARELYKAHVPFDVVLDTDTGHFASYRVLIVPNVDLMSAATAAALHSFGGKLVTIGATGGHDEWYEPRRRPALQGRAQKHFRRVSAKVAAAADTGLLRLTAPASLQIGLRRGGDGYRLVLINTAAAPAPAFAVTMRVEGACVGASAHISTPQGPEVAVPVALAASERTVQVAIPAGIETIALLTVRCTSRMDV